ncbi:MAG: hypothetical protein QGG38_07010 [Nitrospinaceae bacterium]|nr:hypothetical protein [Nitrospinaceae bacterium]
MMETPIVIGGILLFGGVGLLIYLFIISNMKESELVKKLSLTSTLKVVGGPVMFVVSAYFLSQGHWIELWNSFQF